MSVDNKPLPAVGVKKESGSECRICLKSLKDNSKMYCLFDAWDPPWDGMEANIADDLNRLTNIEVTKTDILSKVICGPCYGQLQQACTFVKLVHKNDQFQKKSVHIEINVPSKSVWPQPIQLDTNIGSNIYNSEMVVEVKQEVLSEEEMDMRPDGRSSEMCLDEVEIKVEPEEIVPQYPVLDISVGTLRPSRAYRNTKKSNSVYLNEEYLEEVKEEVIAEDVDMAPLDLPLECMLCTKGFNSVSGLKAHVIAHHSYKTVRRKASGEASPVKRPRSNKHVCTTCQRTFATPTDLMVHATCHSSVTCYVCKTNFDTFEQLTKHQKRCAKGQASETKRLKTLDDVKRVQQAVYKQQLSRPPTLTCPSCPEQFSDIYYLSIHQEIHHTTSNNDSCDASPSCEQPASKNEPTKAEGKVLEGVDDSLGMEDYNDKSKGNNEQLANKKGPSGVVDIVVERMSEEDNEIEASLGNERPSNENESSDNVNIVVERVTEPLEMEEEKKTEESSSGEYVANENEPSGNINKVLEPVGIDHNIEATNVNESETAGLTNETSELNILENILSGNVNVKVLMESENENEKSVNMNLDFENECAKATNEVIDSANEPTAATEIHLEPANDGSEPVKNGEDLPDLSDAIEDQKDVITDKKEKEANIDFIKTMTEPLQSETVASSDVKDNLENVKDILDNVNENLEDSETLGNKIETSDLLAKAKENEKDSSDSAPEATEDPNEKSPTHDESESLESIFGVIPCGK